MPTRSHLQSVAAALMLTVAPLTSFAQWPHHPTPGVPRTGDGKPDMSAPAPRTADGKPDFSGMWGWVNVGPPCGAHCNDLQISREFLNIAYTLKDGPPYQPWASELVKQRKADLAKDDPNVRCMPRGAPRIWTDDYYKRIFHVEDPLVIVVRPDSGSASRHASHVRIVLRQVRFPLFHQFRRPRLIRRAVFQRVGDVQKLARDLQIVAVRAARRTDVYP